MGYRGKFLNLGISFIGAALLSPSSLAAKKTEEATPKKCTSTILAEAKTPFEQAIGLSIEKKFDEVVYLLQSGQLTEQQVYFIWKWWADNNNKQAVQLLGHLEFDSSYHDDIAKALVRIVVEDKLTLYGKVKDPKIRFLLLDKLSKTQSIAEILATLPVDEFLVELVCSQIEAGKADEVEPLISNCKEVSPRSRFLISLALAEGANDVGEWDIPFDDFSDDEQAQIALAAAKRGQNIAMEYLPKIQDRHVRIKGLGYFLANYSNEYGWGGLDYPGNLKRVGLELNSDGYEVAAVIVENLSLDRIAEREERDGELARLVPQTLIRNETAHRKLARVLFMRDFLHSVAQAYGVTRPDLLPFDAQGDGPDLRSVLSNFSRHYPEMLPPELLSTLIDGKVRNSQVIAFILDAYFGQVTEDSSEFHPQDALEMLCRVSGLEFCSLAPSKLGQSPGQLFALVSDIQSHFVNPAFRRVRFDPAVYDKKDQVIELLKVLSSLALKVDEWNTTLETIGILDSPVTVENIGQVTERAQKYFVDQFKKTLAESNVEITFEKLMNLSEKWGDLEPIMTLFERFQSNENWHPELPVLTEVLNASLEGRFSKYKFDPKTEQLEFLKANALKAWTKSRAMAKISSGEKPTLVLSVVNADAKFLLTIGDLVPVTSCQNYRTGSHIQALLGYVIDGGVKAMASFVLKQQDFETAAAYNSVMAAFKEEKNVEISFNGNRKIATFSFERNGEAISIDTLPLGHAYLRQMVKLGKTDSGAPGIRLEKEYLQSHGANETMRENHQSLLEEMVRDMHADQSEPIEIAESRNPGGVYSDLNKGFHTDSYSLE